MAMHRYLLEIYTFPQFRSEHFSKEVYLHPNINTQNITYLYYILTSNIITHIII
jgi:hypothetical protein